MLVLVLMLVLVQMLLLLLSIWLNPTAWSRRLWVWYGTLKPSGDVIVLRRSLGGNIRGHRWVVVVVVSSAAYALTHRPPRPSPTQTKLVALLLVKLRTCFLTTLLRSAPKPVSVRCAAKAVHELFVVHVREECAFGCCFSLLLLLLRT